jgi:ubiquinone/menaquinone biosynthesis C-methylase UbiE
MFSKTARYYDKIYSFKDYRTEAQYLTAVIHQHLHSGGRRLLDVACGTGGHIEHLKEDFEVEGLDISAELLALARQRHPGVLFHQADMIHFNLARQFDVVTCLFSSIGYVRTVENLRHAINCMAQHMVPGGVMLIEPWFTPEAWRPGTVHALFVDEPELKIARINTSEAEGRLSYLDLHYLIGTPEGTEHCLERHELGLFQRDEMTAAMEAAGLQVRYEEGGVAGRGLYIGGLRNPSRPGPQ